jgi:hypothetical protein
LAGFFCFAELSATFLIFISGRIIYPNLKFKSMKIRLFTFLLLSVGNILYGQSVSRDLYYLSGALNFGNYFGTDLNIEYILKGKTSFKAGLISTGKNVRDLPEDFSTIQAKPTEQFGAIYFCAGTVIYPAASKKIRLNLSAGPALGLHYLPYGFYKVPSSPNPDFYFWETEKKRFPALVIHPELELPLHKFFGISVSPIFVAGSEVNYYGISLGGMIGKLRVE